MKTTLIKHLQSKLPHLELFAPAIGNGLSERYRDDHGQLAPKVEAIEEGETMMVNEYPLEWLEAQPIESLFETWKTRHLENEKKRRENGESVAKTPQKRRRRKRVVITERIR